MKKLVIVFVLLTSISSFAQSNSLSTNVSKSKGKSQKGFYMGLDYMNLTDLQIKYKFKSDYGNHSGRSERGTSLGVGGVTLGYNQTPDRGFGFSAGARFLEAINRSEYGDQKLQMIIPEGNITLAASSLFTIYAGLNAAVWTGSTAATQYKTQLGAQAGMGLRFTKNLALNAGYTMMNQKYSETDDYLTEYELEMQISGFTSSLVYTF